MEISQVGAPLRAKWPQRTSHTQGHVLRKFRKNLIGPKKTGDLRALEKFLLEKNLIVSLVSQN